MERKNILFISSWFPNKVEPSNGNFVQRHAEAVSLKHHVEILHSIGDFHQKDKYLMDDQVINGIRTLIVYYRNSKNPLQNFYRRMTAYKMGFAKMKKPDLVHANVLHNSMFFAVYLTKKFRIPFVISEHWTAYQENASDAHGKLWRFFAKWIANHSAAALPVSENLKKGLVVLGVKRPIKVVSNVVDTDVFKLNKEVKKREIFTFLHVSSLVERKNPDKIIETAKKLFDAGYKFRLDIGGSDFGHLEKQISSFSATDYISTFGLLPLSGVAEKMQQSHTLILFSENETQGCVLVEANACGIPVISSKVGGVPEFVNQNAGILVEKDNVESLYVAMEKMLLCKVDFASPEILHQQIEEKYSKDKISTAFSEIYESVLK
ncbi:glycosyltransferase [Chryseobacterium sp. 09-1422]|uniref:Glycosyltransferase n=1 Tax=Chryseobacterium kimseyorum TaxID=2984028 RepID=A0ABT3I046_9FLAO|nr:glycosyltransferase [Chryseobacterium kimseyorum]MCW3169310.1 glycosyltransferase [Chryseobacterium kimseyorum]